MKKPEKFILKLTNAHYLNLLVNAFWAVPAVIIMRLLRPIKHIYLLELRSDRIGHFVPDGGELVFRFKSGEKFDSTYFYFSHSPVNRQWGKMIKRNVPICQFAMPIGYFNNRIPGGEKHKKYATQTVSRDPNGLFYSAKFAQMSFLPSEASKCEEWLNSLGFQKKEKFVTLIARDDKYLLRFSKYSSSDFNYHNHRNVDIDSFKDVILYLLKEGFWVFRMGKSMSKPMMLDHPKFVDYAFRQDATDLYEIWLFAHSNFTISSGTGPDTIPNIYRRPTLFLNMMPLRYLHDYHYTLTVPKRLTWEKTGLPLTLKEHITHDYLHNESYDKNGINVEDLTPTELLEAVREFWMREQGIHPDDPEGAQLQELFWNRFRNSKKYKLSNGWKHPKSRVGTAWLKSQNTYFFD